MLPDWDVRPAVPPFTRDGSGNTVAVSGHAFLAVRLSPADAHTAYAGPKRFSPPGAPEVTEIVITGDYEAVVSWVIGLEDLREFDVTVLDAPKRLVRWCRRRWSSTMSGLSDTETFSSGPSCRACGRGHGCVRP